MRKSQTGRLRGSRYFALSSSVIALGIALSATAAFAQETNGETVVVTGIRKGIQDSISAKKKSTSIVEVVSAEDIGKLPDASVAESIARLAGIAAQRDNGRAQTLSIRGLGPDFTVTTFNGREQASTNDNRTVELDQYPSELVSQVKVFKTPDAGMAYQGLAGTADINTVSPIAYGKRTISLNYRHELDSMDSQVEGYKNSGDRFSGVYINNFKDRTVGVALGVAYNKSPYQSQVHEVWGFNNYYRDNVSGLLTGDGATNGTANTLVGIGPGGAKDGYQSSHYKRTGVFGVLEVKPSDNIHVTLDAYHSDFEELQTIRRLEFGFMPGWAGNAKTVVTPGPVVNGRIMSGSVANATAIIENYVNKRTASVDSLGLKGEFKLDDKWSIDSDLSYSHVDRQDINIESTAGVGGAQKVTTDTAKWATLDDGTTQIASGLNYADFNTTFLTDPNGWGGGPLRSGYLKMPQTQDEIMAVKLAATRSVGAYNIKSLSFGFNHAIREKSKDWWQSILYLPSGDRASVPTQYRLGTASADFMGNSHGMISYDALGLLNSGFWTLKDARIDTNAGDGDRTFDITSTWKVREKLTTFFVKADIDGNLAGLPVVGNVGVQAVTADQTTFLNLTPGVQADKTVPYSTVERGTKYTDVLPSLNLNFTLPHEFNLRVAAAKTVARPRMDDLGGGRVVSVVSDTGQPNTVNGTAYYWSASNGGNPSLEPWRADAYDVSLERYFGRKGYVSLALYYKNLTSYIVDLPESVDFTGSPLPTSPGNTYAKANANRLGVVSNKTNGKGGYVKGAELTISVPGEVVTPMLDGFGVQFSAAMNKSEIKPNGFAIPLPGLSEHVINTTLYYEKNGFSARVSNRNRGKWLGEVPTFAGGLNYQWVKSESLIDAQIGYEFKDGPAKGLSVNLSGSNLTDEPFTLTASDTDTSTVLRRAKYGSVYTLSVGYKF